MIKKGVITKDQQEIPKRSFAIMGILDGIASIMQIFSATYLPGIYSLSRSLTHLFSHAR